MCQQIAKELGNYYADKCIGIQNPPSIRSRPLNIILSTKTTTDRDRSAFKLDRREEEEEEEHSIRL